VTSPWLVVELGFRQEIWRPSYFGVGGILVDEICGEDNGHTSARRHALFVGGAEACHACEQLTRVIGRSPKNGTPEER